jgi:GGDEF domain-containing protein
MMEQTIIHSLLTACPTGILALDQDITVRWLNPALEQMLDLSGEILIGKQKETLPEELHALFDETDMVHLDLNGQGDRWLQREVRHELDDADKTLKVHYFQDITAQVVAKLESDSLRRKVDELTITDDITGMANRRATLLSLEVQVTRSRRYGNLLTLGAVRISATDPQMARLENQALLSFSQYLRERLRWADTIGRYESQLFLLVMPETSHDDAENLLKQLQQECLEGIPGAEDQQPVRLQISAVAWEKGYDPQRLIKRCLQELE